MCDLLLYPIPVHRRNEPGVGNTLMEQCVHIVIHVALSKPLKKFVRFARFAGLHDQLPTRLRSLQPSAD